MYESVSSQEKLRSNIMESMVILTSNYKNNTDLVVKDYLSKAIKELLWLLI